MLDLKREYEYMQKEIDAAIKRCLDHQQWISGPEVAEFERSVAAYLGMKYCIGVSSGTDALVLSLRALAINLKGEEYFDRTDQIITTPFTFTATGDAILRAGATPVFVDIDQTTYNIDPAKIREYLNVSSNNVVGIIPVHLYGRACDMDEIMDIAQTHSMFVVEDVAQAFGGSCKQQKLGSFGMLGGFSFFPTKNLGGFGDGGMVSTNDYGLAELVRMLVKHGGKDKYNVEHIGYNARLDTLQAAILIAKMQCIDDFNERKKTIADLYHEGLKGLNGIVLPNLFDADSHHSYNQYTCSTPKRDELNFYLKEKGISTMVYYPLPLHRMRAFGEGRSIASGSLENSEQACQSVLSLPIDPLQDRQTTDYVIRCINEFFGQKG